MANGFKTGGRDFTIDVAEHEAEEPKEKSKKQIECPSCGHTW